jgi:beta-glucosidase
MRKKLLRIVVGIASTAGMAICGAVLPGALAQDAANPPYLNTNLPAEQRAADLVHRMTLQEKASQLVNVADAIPRLKIPAYNWWSEALHGVATEGVTEFPEPVGLASTFDSPRIHEMGVAIGTEGRVTHIQAVRAGRGAMMMAGLDFWAPNLNIFRDPRWGRGQETYGEDPYLTGRMGVAYVTGMQGDDPNHYRVIATPKHYAVHSGPEPTRHMADVDISKHDEVDTYEPAFRAAITEGKAGSIMCAYNAINGEPACASEYLLQDQLRNKWGFQGYVVSDCGAVKDIFNGHHYEPTQAQASAISLIRGMDNECATGNPNGHEDVEYKPYIDAVQQGFLTEDQMDTALIRLFTARIKLGMFDPPELDPYSKIDEKELSSPEHRELARKIGDESMVLLKNDGTLPLKPSVKKILVVGPLADQTSVLLGNYNGRPAKIVSVLDGIKAEFPNATVTFVPGTPYLRSDGGEPVPDSALTTPDGKPGLKAVYSKGGGMRPMLPGSGSGPAVTPLATRVEKNIALTASNLPAEVAAGQTFNVTWTGYITAPDSGDYLIGAHCDGFARVSIDGKQVSMAFRARGGSGSLGRVHLEKGQKAELTVTYGNVTGFGNQGGQAQAPPAQAQLVWAKLTNQPSPEALAAAKTADVVIAAVGITSQLEGEEMPVNEPGFHGGDRTSIDLPKPEQDLLEAVASAGKPVVVVLTNGSALAVNWAKEHTNAILDAFYPGEEGGTAVAQTLSGRNNPAGRLPVTFYTGVDQLPPFDDYAMKGRTYRYFEGEPLYPFGYGLSYTAFTYSGLTVPTAPVEAGRPMMAEVTVTNTGKRAGDEVAQLYLSFPNVAGAPHLALRGFERIHLEAGASRKVRFALSPRDMSMVTEKGVPIVAEGEYTLSVGGGQPHTGAQVLTQHFKVKGEQTLPE